MKVDRKQLCLYAVTDRRWLGNSTLAQQVELALEGGVTFLQLREKDAGPQEILEQARQLLPICRRFGVPLIINDNVELALASGADGVHLGQGDMDPRQARRLLGPDRIIGVSAHNPQEARLALEGGADYLGAGAVFHTGTKTDAGALPRQALEEICRSVDIPVVAIGGITRENVLSLAGSGVAGAAVVSAIFAQPDVKEAAREMAQLCRKVAGLR
ncbi:thiamine phosphate synthase [Angelakisella massiliensis]|uniref:thiamine phosphate synthase n=1 Tax=Angelakisella massiliensis TaxID=1871018 RepID=UPI0024B08A8B|nr:thiamine phosphate synthase [Angelakisella massiliensis]